MKNTKLLAVTLLGAVLALAGCGETTNSSSEGVSSSTETVSSSVETPSSSTETPSTSSETPSTSEESSKSSSESSSESSSSSSDPDDKTDAEITVEALNAAITGQSSVKSVIYKDGSDTEHPYEFGIDKYGEFVKIDDSYQTQYIGHRQNGDVYGISYSKSSDYLSSVYGVTADFLLGYKVYVSPLYVSDVCDGYFYGAEGFLRMALSYVEANANQDVAIDPSSTDGFFSFSFGVVNQDWNKNNQLTVFTFDMTASDEAVTELVVSYAKYTGENIEADYETGTYHVAEDGSPAQNGTFTFNQTVGEKTLENPYDIESLYYSSITYNDSTGAAMGDEYSVSNGNQLILTVGESAPKTANANIDTPTLTYTGGKEWGISSGYYQGKITIYTYYEGDYVCTIKTANTSKSFTLHVTPAKPESIGSVSSYIPQGDTYEQGSIEESTTIYVGGSISLSATVSPYKADQGYKMEVVGDNASSAAIAKETIKVSQWDDGTEVYTFTSSTPGTYSVKITATADETVSKTISIEVKEAPELSSLLSKRYAYSKAESGLGVVLMYDISFTPSESDPTTGSVSITTDDGYTDPTKYECAYTYDATTKAFTLTKDGETFTDVKLSFSGTYSLLVTETVGDYESTVSTFEFDAGAILTKASGSWSAEDSNEATLKLSMNYDGTMSFSFDKMNYDTYDLEINVYVDYIAFTTTETEDGYTINFSEETMTAITSADPALTAVNSLVIEKDFSKIKANITVSGEAEALDLAWSRW